MKIIEGLKLQKELLVKANDLRGKIAAHCAHLSIETPVYPDQKGQIAKWLQAHEDILREAAKLNSRIAKTNLATIVGIKIGSALVEKSITEWIYRRRILAPLDLSAWQLLLDRGLKEGHIQGTPGTEPTKITIVRCYDPVARDEKVLIYKGEPGLIDRTLEVTNAQVDLLD
jgi:hypothetical protein